MGVEWLHKEEGCGESGFSLQAVEIQLLQKQSWKPVGVSSKDKVPNNTIQSALGETNYAEFDPA